MTAVLCSRGLRETLVSDIDRMERLHEVQQEAVEVRYYEGRLVNDGQLTKAFVKMYPRNPNGDALATNELKLQCDLQPPSTSTVCDQLSFLLGGYQTDQAHCLVFQKNGQMVTLGAYVKMAAEAMKIGRSVGSGDVWDVMHPIRTERKRQAFLIQIFRDIAQGGYLHISKEKQYRMQEGDVTALNVQLRDLAFGIDVSDEAMSLGTTLEEIWNVAAEKERQKQTLISSDALWTRARTAGAWSEADRRNFGIADDLLSLGLLFLYVLLTAFTEGQGMDGLRLYRLVQTTFDSDLHQFRDYCLEDDAFETAVQFLDMEDGAGWELIQALIQPDWKSRPTAASCLNHRFLNRTLFENDQ